MPDFRTAELSLIGFTITLLLISISSLAAPPIVQPGAPGQPSRLISAEEAVALAGLRHSAADTRFMQDMIPHHQQALDMTVLVADRTARSEMMELARRIESSQSDEIDFMEKWLTDRGEALPGRDWRAHVQPPSDHHAHHHHHHTMQGMATIEQMEALAQARGHEFDTLFLELMIAHHDGALIMVEDLLEEFGSAYDPELFEFITDIKNDQQAEIERMTAMVRGFSPDPRSDLAAGFRDAEQAIWNLELIAALPKPAGFFDPENPAGLPLSRLQAQSDIESEENTDAGNADDTDADERPAPLDFANTDMAFGGDLLAVGNYHGFKLYDLSNNGLPELLSAVVCPGGQGDVSIVGDLLIVSVEQNRGRLDCGLQGVAEKVSEHRFRGLRIFDISDPTLPTQVGAVQTCRGSHTHTVVTGPDETGRIIVYNSGTAPVREEEELEGCLDKDPFRDERTALFRIDVIEIPVDRPEDARIIHSPAVFADPDTGILAGLWERGDHGPDTQTTSETNHCHDITVFPDLAIAAGACSGNGILFDISDPINPARMHEVIDPGFAYWHSATFNNDGSKVIFTDEWGGGTRARCRAQDPRNWGANAIYDIVDGKLEFRSYYKMPAPQTDSENCVAHNGSLVPVPGRDIMVQAWYQGGISVFDFTDSANPVEIAFFDRGPIDEETLITGGYWSAYWYQGLIYGTEIVRGLDVLALIESDHLSASEIAATRLADTGIAFNPQQQFGIAWPAEPVVARAYIDQLARSGVLTSEQGESLAGLLDRVEASPDKDQALLEEISHWQGLLSELERNQDGAPRQQLREIGRIFGGMESL